MNGPYRFLRILFSLGVCFEGALSGLKNFLPTENPSFSVMQKNGLIRKIRLISKFMTSQPGNQSNAIHTLPNISRSKDNQKMKLGLLIEHHRNIFLEKSYTYCAAEAISRPFSTKSKLKISLDQHPEFLFILFYLSLCSKSMNTKIY